jgi:DNA-directed RNA polymerase specialized sigma24 family protein
VIDATRETTDAEDVVQDVYMSIVRDLPAFDRVCTPGAWIDRVAYRSIRSFLHGKMTQTHPQSHSDRHHDSRRRSV